MKLKFSHRLACANVVLVKGTGFEEGEFEAIITVNALWENGSKKKEDEGVVDITEITPIP